MTPRWVWTLGHRPEAKRSMWLGGVWFPVGVYALTRLFVVLVVLIAGKHQIAIPMSLPEYHSSEPTGAAPGYWSIMTNWDGQWYREIATHGYPGVVPHDAAGHVVQNVWGFYPLYPLLAGALMWLTGLSFSLVAPAVSLVFGALAVVVLFHLIEDARGTTAARMATVLTCTFVSAPVLQAAYTESPALLLLCSCLLLLRRRRYVWAMIALVLLALTRNVVLAMAPVIVLHGIVRWRTQADDEFTTRDRLTVGGLAALSVALTGLWPAIAAVATGEASTYTLTMAGWGGGLRVVTGWSKTFADGAGTGGLILFIMLLLVFFALLAQPGPRRWGPELWGWAFSYSAYLILATAFGSSTPRHLLLAFPLSLLAVDFIRSMGSRILRVSVFGATACAGLALQAFWVANFLVVTTFQHFP